MPAPSPPVLLRAVPRLGPAPVASSPPDPAAMLRVEVDGPGLDLVGLLQDAVLCRPRGSPEVKLQVTAVHLRLQGRTAEAWLASWLQAWFRWVDGLACGTVQARLSTAGAPARARLRLEFTSHPWSDGRPAAGKSPLEAAPCWRTFLPLGAALHEIHPAAQGPHDDACRRRPPKRLHRVHIDLGPCRADPGDRDG